MGEYRDMKLRKSNKLLYKILRSKVKIFLEPEEFDLLKTIQIENDSYTDFTTTENRIGYVLDLFEKINDATLVHNHLTEEKETALDKLKINYGKDEIYFKKIKILQKVNLIDLEILKQILEYENSLRLERLRVSEGSTRKNSSILNTLNVTFKLERISGRFTVKELNGLPNVISDLLVKNMKYKIYESKEVIYIDELLKSNVHNVLKKHLAFTLKHGLDEFKIENGDKILRVLSKLIESADDTEIYLEISDISDIKKSEEINRKLAYYDALTGLANRDLFTEILASCMLESTKLNKLIGVLFIDVDDFKLINDTYGHEAGDEVLIKIARKLEESVRSGDLVSRYAGDEFTVICKSVKEVNDLDCIVKRIMDTLTKKPVLINGKSVNISLSIGVALFPEHSEEMDSLIKCADLAMYKAKNSGKNKYMFYEPTMKVEEIKKEEIKKDLKNAINRGELYIEYMLQFDSSTSKYIGIESLMRWNHPEKGLISPMEFIAVAEDSGMIIEMGYWALDESLKHLKVLHGLGNEELVLGVNFTDSQFRQKDLLPKVLELLDKNGVNADKLMIEISEKTSMWEVDKTAEILKELRDCGIKLCIDDFGTGYSSLKYLHKYPLTTLKIDKSFVQDEEDSDYRVVKSLLALSTSLGIEVLAEGVEDEQQFNLLRSLGCNKLQGYYIGYPMSYDDLYAMLNTK